MNKLHGIIDHTTGRKTDYLYRLSLKALILNDDGELLVVKEAGRDWWDLPGGGMDHDESIRQALARELAEEVCLTGDFTYAPIDMDEPMYLPNANVWQVRVILRVVPEHMRFDVGPDADEFTFIDPALLAASDKESERRLYRYLQNAK